MLKIAIFGSFYRGFYVLSEMMELADKGLVQIVGVATDDPASNFVSAQRRVWQYPHREEERTMVKDLADAHGIDVYNGRVNCENFYSIFEEQWQPDLCLMATFGQRIGARLFNAPPQGFYNFHPSDEGTWPSRYAGGNPFQMMLRDQARDCVITMHAVDAGFDTGEVVSRSPRVYIPHQVDVVDLHKITSPFAGKLARGYVEDLLSSEQFRNSHAQYDLAT